MSAWMQTSGGTLGEALLFALLGALLGTLHFAALRWNARLFLQPGGAGWGVLAQLFRMGLTAVGLLACARVGAVALLAALVGLLLARQLLLHRAGLSTDVSR